MEVMGAKKTQDICIHTVTYIDGWIDREAERKKGTQSNFHLTHLVIAHSANCNFFVFDSFDSIHLACRAFVSFLFRCSLYSAGCVCCCMVWLVLLFY